MIEQLAWYLVSIRSLVEAAPYFRAIVVCAFLYQLDLLPALGVWLLRKAGLVSTEARLEPENWKSAIVVLPTLLRKPAELAGLQTAIRSVVANQYPGRLFVVACIDGIRESGELYEDLVLWASEEPLPTGVEIHVAGTLERSGKAVAMDRGVEFVKDLVEEGRIEAFPEVFFNMDADSTLGSGSLERMVFRLTRRRPLRRSPYHIVTSNVVVPFDQYYQGVASLLVPKAWIALLVAQEYVGSISAGKVNYKFFSNQEVSGALYCTWSDIYLAAPYYATFMQQLRFRDWIRWWLGYPPPRFSDFGGEPLPEALTGPGDDTWMGWFACCCSWSRGRWSADFPRTPVHALGAFLSQYFSRAVAYDPLAKVYSKTPSTVKALFKQRLRWNSSRMQDLLRHGPSLLYHWQAGIPMLASTLVVFVAVTMFATTPFTLLLGVHRPAPAAAFAVLAFAGYFTTRLSSTVVGLLISDSPPREWIKLVALPFAVFYHIVFNTLTLLIGYYRDLFGLGEPTTFAPEATLIRSRLSRFALAYRLRRALLLTVRSAVYGDVPLGSFWFGWKGTPFTPNGFEGWSSGKTPPPVYWPERFRSSPTDPASSMTGRAGPSR
jgi:hypothetical protein